MSDPIIEYTVRFTQAQAEGLWGPYVSDRKAHWWRCFEAMRLARVALEGAADPNVTRTPRRTTPPRFGTCLKRSNSAS